MGTSSEITAGASLGLEWLPTTRMSPWRRGWLSPAIATPTRTSHTSVLGITPILPSRRRFLVHQCPKRRKFFRRRRWWKRGQKRRKNLRNKRQCRPTKLLVPRPRWFARPHRQQRWITWKHHLQQCAPRRPRRFFASRPEPPKNLPLTPRKQHRPKRRLLVWLLVRLVSDAAFVCQRRRSLNNRLVDCCMWSIHRCCCGIIHWFHASSILCAVFGVSLRTDSFFIRYVRHAFLIDPTSFHALSHKSPFFHFTVVLETTTFAMTLNLLNKIFLVTAGRYENISTCNNHHVCDQ